MYRATLIAPVPNVLLTMRSQAPEPVVITLDRTVDAPRTARSHVRAAVGAMADERVEDAMLLVSELVTNAVKYGGEGPVELVIARDDERVRFQVRDHGGTGPLPEIREPGKTGGGHGLRLVDSIADRWGVEHGSTIVWFELDVSA
jgi:anti-sigma regulatory factor (Ser/Thr protein kinase)